MLLCGTLFLSWGFSSSVLSSILGAQGFRSWVSPFWITPRDGPFSLPILNFALSASWEFYGVSRRSVQSRLPSFPENRLLWIWILRYTTLEFFLSESQLLLGCSLSSTSCWVSPHHQHVDTGNYCHKCTCFQTSNHDTREDVENHTTIFYILLHPLHRQGILAPVAGLVELFTSVCPFPVGTEEVARYSRLVWG